MENYNNEQFRLAEPIDTQYGECKRFLSIALAVVMTMYSGMNLIKDAKFERRFELKGFTMGRVISPDDHPEYVPREKAQKTLRLTQARNTMRNK